MKSNNHTTTPSQFNQMVEELLEMQQEANDNPWFPRGEMWVAHQTATAQRDVVRDALRDAIATAPWGQNGSVFITDRSLHLGASDRVRTLYINGLPRAEVKLAWSDGSPWLTNVYTVEEAEQMREDEKANRRATEAAYKRQRQLLIIDLKFERHSSTSPFGDWDYYDGQCGGVFVKKTEKGEKPIYVAAHSALRAAWGEDWMNISHDSDDELFESEWDRVLYGARG